MKIAKKASGHHSCSASEALEQALCYGWIDGQRRSLDDEFYLQSYMPRRARSPWSQRNVGIAERLVGEGLMQSAGHAEIDRAKADGRWESAYQGQQTAELPPDFLDELAKNPAAHAFFQTLNRQNRFAVYFRLSQAKKPETRARRIAQFVSMFAEGKKFH